MFSHTKIKWTIDEEYSRIFFKERCLMLSNIDNITGEMDNLSFQDEQYSNTIEDENMDKNNVADKRNRLYVNIEEFAKNINYNLIIFEEKNSGDFWKRRTFGGLLISPNTGKNMFITLHRTGYSFNKSGYALATFSVKGKLNKNDFDPDTNNITQNETIILTSELLFDGEIRLLEEKKEAI